MMPRPWLEYSMQSPWLFVECPYPSTPRIKQSYVEVTVTSDKTSDAQSLYLAKVNRALCLPSTDGYWQGWYIPSPISTRNIWLKSGQEREKLSYASGGWEKDFWLCSWDCLVQEKNVGWCTCHSTFLHHHTISETSREHNKIKCVWPRTRRTLFNICLFSVPRNYRK